MTRQVPYGIVSSVVLALGGVVVASVLAQRSFGNGFLPHGYCFTWIPGLLWLNVVSDVLIALSYLTIPLTLVYFVSHRPDLPFSWVFVLFGLFIVACGMTHALDVWTVWNADYWLLGGVKAITAAASLTTATVLVWLLPKALAIPSVRQLEEANQALHREVAARAIVERQLEASKVQLTQLVAERTSALNKASALLDDFFDTSPLGLAVFDDRLRFVKVNPTLAAMHGLAVEQHWGRTFDEVDPEVDRLIPEALKEVRNGNTAVLQMEMPGKRHGEASTSWRVTVHLVPKTGGAPLIGYACEVTDLIELPSTAS